MRHRGFPARCRRGRIAVDAVEVAEEELVIGPASDGSRRAATVIDHALTAMAAMLDAEADELGRLDRIAGDGDHGIGMQRGSRAAAAAASAVVADRAGARTALQQAGDAWADKGGGTSGAIWGEMLVALGATLGDEDDIDAARTAAGVTAMKDAVMSFGKAKVGDKTMIDAIVPFADRLAELVGSGAELVDAWTDAAGTADAAAKATADLTAKLGRARAHGDKSLGTPDPGAVSFALIAYTVLETLKGND